MEIIFSVSSTRQKEAEALAEKITQKYQGLCLVILKYVLPTQDETLVYTTSVIDLSQKPTILYNNPKKTGIDLSIKNMVELSVIE